MKTSIKKLPHSQVELTVHVPYAFYAQFEQIALEEANKHLKVDGFRAGHIPESVVRERIKPELLKQASIEKLLPKVLMQAAKENDLNIVAPPKVDIQKAAEKEGDEMILVATMDIMPEVTLGDHQKIKVKKKPVSVEPKQVEETLNMMMERFVEWKEQDRPAQMGDRVEVDFQGFDEAKQVVPNTQSKNHPLILGSQSFIPGFEEELVGLKPGEEKEFTLTFPKDYHAEAMREKKITFQVKVLRLEEKEKQVLDEAMVEKISGKKQSLEELKKQVEADLTLELAQRSQAEHDQAIVDEISKITQVELPASLVEQELEEIKNEKKRQLSQQGLKWEDYLSYLKKSEEDFEKDYQKSAQYRLKARMGIHEMVKKLEIKVSEEEVEKEIQDRAQKLSAEEQKEMKAYYAPGSEGRTLLKNNLIINQLMTHFTA